MRFGIVCVVGMLLIGVVCLLMLVVFVGLNFVVKCWKNLLVSLCVVLLMSCELICVSLLFICVVVV